MSANQIIERIKNGKNLSDNEWLEIRRDILEFLASDPPEEEARMFIPLGYLELVTMMCDGIRLK